MTSNTENNEHQNSAVGTPARTGVGGKVAIGALAVAGLGGLWYQGSQLSTVRADLAHTQQVNEENMRKLSSSVDANVTAAKSQVDQTIADMNAAVEKARKDAQISTQRATASAKQQANEVMTQLSAKNEELKGQVNTLKADNEQKSAQVQEALTAVKGDVGGVRTDLTTTQSDVASTKSQLDNTIADLKRATGDMGVMSGLIATNSTELQALRRLGEKDYFAFTLPKKSGNQKVGDVQLKLKKADTKHNKFTVEVMADDKIVEKKDKGLNEPVQFYTAGSRAPYEVVVNEIRKDTVVGYLAVPKVKVVAQR